MEVENAAEQIADQSLPLVRLRNLGPAPASSLRVARRYTCGRVLRTSFLRSSGRIVTARSDVDGDDAFNVPQLNWS
jgi:hypothetical protein